MSALPKLADKKSLKNLVPLNGLSPTHFEELAKKATVLELKPGKYLFKKGERDNSTCFVLEGEIALVDGSDIKLTIEGGTAEARHPIAAQQPRQLGARAKTHCTIVSIDSGLLDVMLAWEQSSGYEVDEFESDDEDWMTRMMQSDLMQKLPANNLQQLFMRMQEVDVKGGDVVVNQDDEGDYYYIIKQGKCVVSRKPSANAREVKLAELKDGDSFGEESLLSGAKRNASVTMLTNGKLMRLSKNDFNELLKTPLLSQLGYGEAKQMVEEGAVFLDVRLPGEYNNAHLQDSINMPLAAIRSEISSIDRDKDYIVYCDTGRRSTSAVFLLGQFGIDAHVLKDGLSNVPLEDYNPVEGKGAESAEIIDINRDKSESSAQQVDAAELQAIDAEKSQLENNVKKLVAEVASLKEQISDAEQKIAQHESELQETQAAVKQEQANVRSMEDELQGLRDLEIESDKLKEKLEKAQVAADEQGKLLITARQSDESAQKKLLSQQAEMERLEKDLRAAVSRAAEAEELHETNIRELESLHAKMEVLQSEKDALGERLLSVEREKDALGKGVDASVTALNEEITSLRASLEEIQANKAGLEEDLQQGRQQQESLQQQLQNKSLEQGSLEQKIAELNQTLDAERKHAQQLQSENAERIEELRGLQEKLEQQNQSSDQQSASLQQQLQDKSAEQQVLENRIAELSAVLDEEQSRARQLQSDNAERLQELQALEGKLQQQNQSSDQHNVKLQTHIEELEQHKTKLEQDMQASLARIDSLESELQQQSTEKQSILSDSEQNNQQLQAKLEEAQQQRQQQESEIGELKTRLQESESSLASLMEARKQEKGDGLDRIKTLESGLEQAAREHGEQVSAMQAQLSDYEEQQRHLQAEIQKLTEQSAQETSRYENEKASFEQQVSAGQETIKALKAELETSVNDSEARESELLAQLAEFGDNRRQMEAELKSLRDRSAENESMFASERQILEQQNLSNQEAVKTLKAELEELSRQKSERESELQQSLSTSEVARQQLTKEIEELTSRINESEASLTSAREDAERQNNLSQARISALESELEGVGSETAALLQARQELQESAEKYQQEIDQGREDRQQLESQLEALNRDLEDLRTAQNVSEQEQEKQVIEYRQQLELQKIENAAVDERYQRAQKRIDELIQVNTQLESGVGDEALHNEIQGLRGTLDEAEQKLQDNASLLAQKTHESDEIRKELAALRAVYVQKESEFTELQNKLESAAQTISDFHQQDDDSNKGKQAAEEELKLVRERFEQSEIESKEIITGLQKELQEKDSLIDEYNDQASQANALRTDAESAFKVMEEEVNTLRNESDQYQQSLHNSHEQLQALQQELDKLREEQKNWRITEEDMVKANELEMSQARVKELEAELQQSSKHIDAAREKIAQLENSVQKNDRSKLEHELQGKIEQLKHDMEGQLERYKSDLDDESGRLRKENDKLRDELQNAYKEQEIAIQTGRPVTKGQQPQQVEEAGTASVVEDHAALFNLPDIDKNLFNTNTDRPASKSNTLMMVVLVLLFSLLSAGGVYWYFVMHKGAQATSAPSANTTDKTSDVLSGKVSQTQIADAGTIQASPARETTPRKPVKATPKTVKASTAIKGQLKPTRVFSDFLESGGSGPVMVGVPGGIFTMGSPVNSTYFNERPQHKVSIRKFTISKYEVSFDDYDRFAEDSGRPRPADNGWGRGKRPVINVSWEDAVAYTQWLSKQTGHQYRLPSEAEWEYSARAGSKEKYWWGAQYENNRANCFNCGSRWDRVSSAPVGSFSPSSLGLHDMSGNVMEWVSDCYHQNYDGAPIDGTIWSQGACSQRVVRGGSFHSPVEDIRVSKRSAFDAGTAVDQIGFRVVRVR